MISTYFMCTSSKWYRIIFIRE